MELKRAIEQRKTIKSFEPNTPIARETLSEMLTLAQLAPSKANLQPWRFVVVDEAVVKKQVAAAAAFNAVPCETASAVILVLADLHYEQLLGDILDHSVANGCLAEGYRDRSYDFLLNTHNALTPEQIRDQVLIDSSLPAMQLMLLAKEYGFDTHAIGIFDREAVMNILNVDAERYAPVMLIAIGKAATDPLPSVRLPLDYTVAWNSADSLKR